MNKFKRKPLPFSPVALGRQMAADANRMRKKIAKQKPVEFSMALLPDHDGSDGMYASNFATAAEMHKILTDVFADAPPATTVDNGDGTYTHTYTFDTYGHVTNASVSLRNGSVDGHYDRCSVGRDGGE